MRITAEQAENLQNLADQLASDGSNGGFLSGFPIFAEGKPPMMRYSFEIPNTIRIVLQLRRGSSFSLDFLDGNITHAQLGGSELHYDFNNTSSTDPVVDTTELLESARTIILLGSLE